MIKQKRTTKTIEINPKDHFNFNVDCMKEDKTQAELFSEIYNEWRLNGK